LISLVNSTSFEAMPVAFWIPEGILHVTNSLAPDAFLKAQHVPMG
jgi:hypothetical protein